MKLPVKFVVTTNDPLRLPDPSGALASRLMFLRFTKVFRETEREDTELRDKLKAELPGILLWAIEGWKRLQERRRFTIPDASKSGRVDFEVLPKIRTGT